MNRAQLQRIAGSHGIDLVAYTTSDRVEARVDSRHRPSDISEYLPGFIVIGKAIPSGVSGMQDGEPKPLALAMVHRAVETAAAALAYELEAADLLAVVLPPLAMDFDKVDERSMTPAGQASPLIRTAAVESGLGTAGLNGMVLTPAFGPRVFFGGLMTSLELPPDPPLDTELCPGLEACGRCAAVCPTRAIPLESVRGRSLRDVRNLDAAACARQCQPYGAGSFGGRIRRLVQESHAADFRAAVRGPETALLWYHMTFLRQGAFSACTQCLQVCPVGDDFSRVRSSPHRNSDLPDDFKARVEDARVVVDWLGDDERQKEQC